MLHANDPDAVHAATRSLARRFAARSVFLAAFALAAGALAGQLPLAASEPLPPAEPSLEAALLQATNAARATHGLPALAQDEGLARAAREHAAEMARLHYFSHGSPVAAHATLEDRLALAGSPLTDIAENIVMLGEPGPGTTSAQQAVTDWLNSPHHRANLLGHYDVVGFGTALDADGRLFVVQDFGLQRVQLLSYTLVHASRRIREIELQLHASSSTNALFRVGSDAPVIHTVPAGASTVVLTSTAEGTVGVVVGVQTSGTSYLEDDGGTIDVETGRYQPDAGQPRQRLRIQGATVRSRVDEGARLTFRYTPLPGHTLSLFLQDSQQPEARVGPGSFALFVPDTVGVATVEVGIDGTGSAVAIVHRFHLDPGAVNPRLSAGAAP